MSFDAPVTIRHVRFANEQTGWAVLDAAGADGTPLALVGPLVHLEAGERAQIVGEWVQDSRYGRQVKVSQASPLAPEDPEAVISYLRRVRHIGARRAQELVQQHGAGGVFDAIDGDPEATLAAVGLGGERARQAVESWQALRVTRRLHLLLAPHGLAYLAGRIHDHYGSGAHDVIAANPYELTSLFGVGFTIADRIARGAAAAGTAIVTPGQRERAAVMHALAEGERAGSACLPAAELEAAARALLGEALSPDTVAGLAGDGQVVREDDWLYRTATAELEAELATRVAGLVRAPASERLGAAPLRAGPAWS